LLFLISTSALSIVTLLGSIFIEVYRRKVEIGVMYLCGSTYQDTLKTEIYRMLIIFVLASIVGIFFAKSVLENMVYLDITLVNVILSVIFTAILILIQIVAVMMLLKKDGIYAMLREE
jgi:hypothetical protein